jgi:ubiquinone/menaquinone biosynthesis C-methylase UbiE
MTERRRRRVVCFAALSLVGIFLVESPAGQLESKPREVDRDISRSGMIERLAELKIDEVIALLKLKPGDVVADIGAGSGVFSYPMARAIAPGGALFAVEIHQGFLDHINEQARKEEIGNIRTVLGEYGDPKLPVRDLDVAFFHRVLHHIERRAAYLDTLAGYLKPAGRIAVIEKGPDDVDDWMWLKREHVDAWMAAIGFYPAEELDLFDNKWFVVYQRPYGSPDFLRRAPSTD